MELFKVHDGLMSARRIPAVLPAARITAQEILLLVCAGAAAATISAFLKLGLRIPGSAIIWTVMPMALGFSLVPRRLGGVVMSASALATAVALSAGGVASFGVGALTSLCLTGPMLDIALVGAGPGWQLYARFIAAGFATNLVAFLERGASKLLHADQPGTRLFGEWLGQAMLTYTLAGAVAGLLAGLVYFRGQGTGAGIREQGSGNRDAAPMVTSR